MSVFYAKDGNGTLWPVNVDIEAGVVTFINEISSLPSDPLGAMADLAVVGDNPGTVSAKLRGILKQLAIQLPTTLGQKVMAASLPVTFASDQTGISIGALGASELHVGQVTTPLKVSSPALTVIASAAYTQGFCVGGIISFTNAARVAAGSGKIISVLLVDANQQNASYELLLFDTNPSHSTFTDGAVAILDPNDFGYLLGSIDISTYVSIGSVISPITARSFARVSSNITFALPSGTTVFGVLVLKSSSSQPTYNNTGSLSIRMWVDQN